VITYDESVERFGEVAVYDTLASFVDGVGIVAQK
jgi:hypothetical protein